MHAVGQEETPGGGPARTITGVLPASRRWIGAAASFRMIHICIVREAVEAARADRRWAARGKPTSLLFLRSAPLLFQQHQSQKVSTAAQPATAGARPVPELPTVFLLIALAASANSADFL